MPNRSNGLKAKRPCCTPRPPLPQIPTRALAFSNYTTQAYLSVLREACERKGIKLDAIGSGVGRVVAHPEHVLGRYDLVFAKGKAALEALAVGAAVIVCDALTGIGPMVRTENVESLRTLHFGSQELSTTFQVDCIEQEIDRYDPEDAATVSHKMRAIADLEDTVSKIIALIWRP